MTRHQPGLHEVAVDVPDARHVDPAAGKQDTIRAIYRAVDAPSWAAANLDALIDVLRDLSWLPPGPVVLAWPEPTGPDAARLVEAVRHAASESAGTQRPLTVYLVRAS